MYISLGLGLRKLNFCCCCFYFIIIFFNKSLLVISSLYFFIVAHDDLLYYHQENLSVQCIPLEPHFYIVKLGYAGVYLFFLFLLKT